MRYQIYSFCRDGTFDPHYQNDCLSFLHVLLDVMDKDENTNGMTIVWLLVLQSDICISIAYQQCAYNIKLSLLFEFSKYCKH
jgi:hypothetical protein